MFPVSKARKIKTTKEAAEEAGKQKKVSMGDGGGEEQEELALIAAQLEEVVTVGDTGEEEEPSVKVTFGSFYQRQTVTQGAAVMSSERLSLPPAITRKHTHIAANICWRFEGSE